jgi:hypothetical protein
MKMKDQLKCGLFLDVGISKREQVGKAINERGAVGAEDSSNSCQRRSEQLWAPFPEKPASS